MMAINTPRNNKKNVYSMQLASSVNIQLLGITKEASNVAANGDINVVRVSVGMPKKTAMPVLHEQPSEDGVKSMPIFRQQDSANGLKTMPLFRQKGSAKELTSTVSVTQSSINRPASSPPLTPVQQWVSTTSSECGVEVVTAINNNHIERKCDVTKAANGTGSTFVTVEPPPCAAVSPSSPSSSPPPHPPPLPSTHIQLSRSVSLRRPSSHEATSLSAPNSPSSPLNNRNYRPPQTTRVDPFAFSRMINDGRRRLSNEAFSTSNGSSKSSGSSCNAADRTMKSESLERRDADSATGASLPDTATEPSLPDDDASSDSVFSEKSSEMSSVSNTDAVVTEPSMTRSVRAVLISQRDLTVMLKMSCATEATSSDKRVLSLICQIAATCLEHFKRQKVQQFDLTAPNILKLNLGDKPVKEHVAALSRDLGEDIIVSEGVFRKSTKKDYIGTSMRHIVYKEGHCQVAKSGVVVTLVKVNKLAPIQEFVDQVCHHVHVTKPSSMGAASSVVLGRRPQRHERINKRELLSQAFTYDPIISVAEAAHRSFVEIQNFALYE